MIIDGQMGMGTKCCSDTEVKKKAYIKKEKVKSKKTFLMESQSEKDKVLKYSEWLYHLDQSISVQIVCI